MRGTVRRALPSKVDQNANSRVPVGVRRSTSEVTRANSSEMPAVTKQRIDKARNNGDGRTDFGRPVQTIRSPYSESRATGLLRSNTSALLTNLRSGSSNVNAPSRHGTSFSGAGAAAARRRARLARALEYPEALASRRNED